MSGDTIIEHLNTENLLISPIWSPVISGGIEKDEDVQLTVFSEVSAMVRNPFGSQIPFKVTQTELALRLEAFSGSSWAALGNVVTPLLPVATSTSDRGDYLHLRFMLEANVSVTDTETFLQVVIESFSVESGTHTPELRVAGEYTVDLLGDFGAIQLQKVPVVMPLDLKSAEEWDFDILDTDLIGGLQCSAAVASTTKEDMLWNELRVGGELPHYGGGCAVASDAPLDDGETRSLSSKSDEWGEFDFVSEDNTCGVMLKGQALLHSPLAMSINLGHVPFTLKHGNASMALFWTLDPLKLEAWPAETSMNFVGLLLHQDTPEMQRILSIIASSHLLSKSAVNAPDTEDTMFVVNGERMDTADWMQEVAAHLVFPFTVEELAVANTGRDLFATGFLSDSELQQLDFDLHELMVDPGTSVQVWKVPTTCKIQLTVNNPLGKNAHVAPRQLYLTGSVLDKSTNNPLGILRASTQSAIHTLTQTDDGCTVEFSATFEGELELQQPEHAFKTLVQRTLTTETSNVSIFVDGLSSAKVDTPLGELHLKDLPFHLTSDIETGSTHYTQESLVKFDSFSFLSVKHVNSGYLVLGDAYGSTHLTFNVSGYLQGLSTGGTMTVSVGSLVFDIFGAAMSPPFCELPLQGAIMEVKVGSVFVENTMYSARATPLSASGYLLTHVVNPTYTESAQQQRREFLSCIVHRVLRAQGSPIEMRLRPVQPRRPQWFADSLYPTNI
eukprot:Lankesteria_metandrocarpae@DN935_c0_g1_i1.p1